MKIIVFLGNPGRKFKNNRHNAGFIIGKIFADEHKIKTNKKDFQSVYGAGSVNNTDILLLFPQTYMNNSGLAVIQTMRYYNEGPENLIVIHDEIELPFGQIKTKSSGGHKGHNGIRSIINHTGTPDFKRIRIGVGRPELKNHVADFLLSDFTKEELNDLINLAPEIIHLIESEIN